VKISGRDRLIGHESERDPVLTLNLSGEGHPRHHAHVGRGMPGGSDDPAAEIAEVANPAPASARLRPFSQKLQDDLDWFDSPEEKGTRGRK
jgi:hypothetical protein